uniref:DNA polymerase subunit n=2 Tax=Straboviridae TaxID=2946170 RepID=I6YMS9_9CAUD|nr:DNA polymerase subunit [Aeromonas phage Aes123]
MFHYCMGVIILHPYDLRRFLWIILKFAIVCHVCVKAETNRASIQLDISISENVFDYVDNEVNMELELSRDFNEDELGYLNSLSTEELRKMIRLCEKEEQKRNTNQLNRKILINSLYGCLGNNFFRFFNLHNAEAITLYGQLAIRWIERKLNEYINKLIKTENVDYVCYIDTDSVVGDTIIDVSGKKMTIAEFYDSTPDVFMRRNDEARDWVKRVGGKTSLSVNTYSGEVERKNINYIMKHTVKKRMFKIKAGGKEVIVTADHSVMVKRDGKIIDVKPTEMKQTDRVVKWMLT